MKDRVKRKIITIDEEKCDGCGICAEACHEGAIQIIGGKAKLVSETYCDGLGDCIGECPRGAITFEEREAAPYDEEAVKRHMAGKSAAAPRGCPGSMAQSLKGEAAPCEIPPSRSEGIPSALANWPVQIKLVPEMAPFLRKAHLVVAADCTPFAFRDFHSTFLSGENKVCLVGCPKLDDAEAYQEKLTRIITFNDIEEITLVRMEVPCCGGIENAVKRALQQSGKFIPWQVVTISTDGRILD